MKSVAAMELELLRLRSENKTLRELVLWIQETVVSTEEVRERVDLALAETDLVELEIQTPAN